MPTVNSNPLGNCNATSNAGDAVSLTTQNGMGIGSLGSPTLILKKKYRWVCQITNCKGEVLPAYLCKMSGQPSLTIEETELNFLNQKIWIPGKASWETITVTFLDGVDPGSTSGTTANLALLNWLSGVYDFANPNQFCRYQQSTARQDYIGKMILYMFDGCGNVLSQWTINDAWPTSIKFDDLDYTSSDNLGIELTIRYSDVLYTSYCPNGTPSGCGCSDCGTLVTA